MRYLLGTNKKTPGKVYVKIFEYLLSQPWLRVKQHEAGNDIK